MLNEVKVKINDKNLRDIPSFSTPGSAGLDLRASLESPLELKPGKTELIPTGISIYIENRTSDEKYNFDALELIKETVSGESNGKLYRVSL